MSSFNRRAVLAGLGGLALAGCGFSPVYAPGGTGRALRGAVRATDPVTRRDFQFVAALEDALGRPEGARFDLDYRLTVTQIEAGRVQGLGATRIILSGALDFTLTETGMTRSQGQVRAETAYSTLSTQLATQTAAEDADLRLMRMLADTLVSRLLADPALAS